MGNGKDERTLGREDLLLLMESYKNTIEPLTLILEQNKQVVEKLDGVSTILKDVANKLEKFTEEAKDTTNMWEKQCTVLNSNINAEHQSIKHRINIVYLAIGGVVLSVLITMAKMFVDYKGIAEAVAKVSGAN